MGQEKTNKAKSSETKSNEQLASELTEEICEIFDGVMGRVMGDICDNFTLHPKADPVNDAEALEYLIHRQPNGSRKFAQIATHCYELFREAHMGVVESYRQAIDMGELMMATRNRDGFVSGAEAVGFDDILPRVQGIRIVRVVVENGSESRQAEQQKSGESEAGETETTSPPCCHAACDCRFTCDDSEIDELNDEPAEPTDLHNELTPEIEAELDQQFVEEQADAKMLAAANQTTPQSPATTKIPVRVAEQKSEGQPTGQPISQQNQNSPNYTSELLIGLNEFMAINRRQTGYEYQNNIGHSTNFLPLRVGIASRLMIMALAKKMEDFSNWSDSTPEYADCIEFAVKASQEFTELLTGNLTDAGSDTIDER